MVAAYEMDTTCNSADDLFSVCLSVFVLPSSREPGGTASDRGEAEGEASPLEVHQALENPLLHPGGKPAALPERQIRT